MKDKWIALGALSALSFALLASVAGNVVQQRRTEEIGQCWATWNMVSLKMAKFDIARYGDVESVWQHEPSSPPYSRCKSAITHALETRVNILKKGLDADQEEWRRDMGNLQQQMDQ
jgi:hypothetical protein